uniref:Uncharacterized protein n=1 Tax=Arundo donax TaxID=35708 RepID=A0A0A8ZUA9_ARUDO
MTKACARIGRPIKHGEDIACARIGRPIKHGEDIQWHKPGELSLILHNSFHDPPRIFFGRARVI